jgi:hypothetical protein
MISDKRLLPAGVRPPRFFVFELAARRVATPFFVLATVASDPSNAAMARLRRSLSFFRSATILSKSKVSSYRSFSLDVYYYSSIAAWIIVPV